MNQLKLYKYSAYFLLILNLSIIFFFFLGMPRPAGRNSQGFLNVAAEMLELDEQQITDFRKSAYKHHCDMKTLKEEQNSILKSYFNSIYNKPSSISTDSLFIRIKELEGKKIKFTESHFKEIELILREEQKPNFKTFMDAAILQILDNKDNAPKKNAQKNIN